jgi:hypothetical protein
MQQTEKECNNNKRNTLRNTLHYNDIVIISARLPRFIKEYFKNNNISLRKILEDYYYHFTENKLNKLLEEITDMRESVLQKELNVIRLKQSVLQNHEICNTIFESFKQQGRDINNISAQDKFWIRSQLENNEIRDMTVNSFIDYCRNGKEEVEKNYE